MDIERLNEELNKVLTESIEDSLPIGDREEVFNPKPGDIVYVLGIDDNEKDFYAIMGSKAEDFIQVTKICDSQGNILSGDYKADRHQLYDGEGLKKLVDKLETSLKTLKNYI